MSNNKSELATNEGPKTAEELVDDVEAFVEVEEAAGLSKDTKLSGEEDTMEEEEDASEEVTTENEDTSDDDTDEEMDNDKENRFRAGQPSSSHGPTFRTKGPRRRLRVFLTPMEKALYNAIVREKLKLLTVTDPEDEPLANLMAAFNIMKNRKFVNFIENNPKGAAKVTKILEFQGLTVRKRRKRFPMPFF